MYVNTELHAEAIGQGTPIGLFVRVTVPPPASDGDGRVGVVLTTTALSTELFDTFTRLKRDGKIGGLIAGVQVLHPWIEDLELFSEGGQTLAASGGGRKLFPLPLLGEGLMRVAQILLTIAKTEKGVILIDEIERGFHYEALPEVWKAIRAAADAVDVQVFATTHSYECIAAANEVFADSPSDLALIRLQNLHGKVRAIDYPPDVRQSAIEHGSEVR